MSQTDVRNAAAAVEGRKNLPCRKCVWAKNLGERPKRVGTWFYCPFGGNKCLYEFTGEKH
jgi:hypothetical protein